MNSIALSLLRFAACHSLAADGFSSGETKTAEGVITGIYTSLTVNDKVVYLRTYGSKTNPIKSKDAPFTESFLIDGTTVFQLYHAQSHTKALISGTDKYDVQIDFSPDRATIRRVTVTPKERSLEYIWEPDAEGYLAEFHARSTEPPRF